MAGNMVLGCHIRITYMHTSLQVRLCVAVKLKNDKAVNYWQDGVLLLD